MNIETSLNAPRGRAPLASGALVLLGLACAAPAMAAGDDAPLCTDRPTKSNAVCTVPVGDWQVETDVTSYTRDTQPATRTETFAFANTGLKYGMSDTTDLQLYWSPQVEVRTLDRTDGAMSRLSGGGDATLRLKTRFYEGPSVSVAVIPFVKMPTAADGLGNDKWEGGVALPISLSLPRGFTLLLGPELDALADSDGSGTHLGVTNLVNLSHALTPRLGVAVELWSSVNKDPAGTIRQASADVAVSYLLAPKFQVDLGANFGLNDRTPDVQGYVGFAHRF